MALLLSVQVVFLYYVLFLHANFLNISSVQIAEEVLKLRKEQEELESKLKKRVIGLSLFDTILEVKMHVVSSCKHSGL